ncbi:hypothetical protein ACOSQ3_007509 [Xanthoceras sorbifolium]
MIEPGTKELVDKQIVGLSPKDVTQVAFHSSTHWPRTAFQSGGGPGSPGMVLKIFSTPGRHHGGPPHGIILVVVVGIMVLVPFLLGDSGEALTEFITELLSSLISSSCP